MPTTSTLPVLAGVNVAPSNAPARTDIDNLDLFNLLQRIRNMGTEVALSQSANIANGLHPADAARYTDFVQDIRRYFDYIERVPMSDNPETAGRLSYTLPVYDVPSPTSVSNKDCSSLLMQLLVFWWEVANSQSARLVRGVWATPDGQPGDRVRWRASIDGIEAFIQFIAATQPSDRPESAPEVGPVGPGQTGT